MSEPKFTPGPWYAAQPEECGGWWIVAKDPEGCDCIDSGDGGFGKADAHLISAAPELYEALEAVIYVQTEHEGRPIFSHTQQKSGTRQWRIDAMEAYKKAEIAFKKARGDV